MQLGEEGGEEGVAEGFIVWLPAAHLFLNFTSSFIYERTAVVQALII